MQPEPEVLAFGPVEIPKMSVGQDEVLIKLKTVEYEKWKYARQWCLPFGIGMLVMFAVAIVGMLVSMHRYAEMERYKKGFEIQELSIQYFHKKNFDLETELDELRKKK